MRIRERLLAANDGENYRSAAGHGTAMWNQAEWAAKAVLSDHPDAPGIVETRAWLQDRMGPKWHAGYGWALDHFDRRVKGRIE